MSARERSSRTLSISFPWGTLRTSPHERSPNCSDLGKCENGVGMIARPKRSTPETTTGKARRLLAAGRLTIVSHDHEHTVAYVIGAANQQVRADVAVHGQMRLRTLYEDATRRSSLALYPFRLDGVPSVGSNRIASQGGSW